MDLPHPQSSHYSRTIINLLANNRVFVSAIFYSQGMSLPVGGHYEWGLVVPSQEMRTNLVLSLNSQTSENVEGTHAAVRIVSHVNSRALIHSHFVMPRLYLCTLLHVYLCVPVNSVRVNIVLYIVCL